MKYNIKIDLDNIHKDLRIALKKLKDRVVEKEIIITKADKGSGLVALDYELYITKGTHYIEIESQAYKKTEENQKLCKMEWEYL